MPAVSTYVADAMEQLYGKKIYIPHDIEHRMLPFIEKYKLINEAVEKFGRI